MDYRSFLAIMMNAYYKEKVLSYTAEILHHVRDSGEFQKHKTFQFIVHTHMLHSTPAIILVSITNALKSNFGSEKCVSVPELPL